jgi:hypothetical protein
MSWMFLKNEDGKQSVSLTMMFAAFVVMLFWLVASICLKDKVREFDASTASGFLGPLIALYFGRRWTDAKTGSTLAATTPTNTDSQTSPSQ